jgi:hypothetical protein
MTSPAGAVTEYISIVLSRIKMTTCGNLLQLTLEANVGDVGSTMAVVANKKLDKNCRGSSS